MSDFVEAIVVMLPREAGGRASAVFPREGNYRPYVREAEGPLLRVRFIEGPPTLSPGDVARVVMEMDGGHGVFLPGCELDLLEHEAVRTGLVTVSRVWPTG
jgi:hypothetical protein